MSSLNSRMRRIKDEHTDIDKECRRIRICAQWNDVMQPICLHAKEIGVMMVAIGMVILVSVMVTDTSYLHILR